VNELAMVFTMIYLDNTDFGFDLRHSLLLIDRRRYATLTCADPYDFWFLA